MKEQNNRNVSPPESLSTLNLFESIISSHLLEPEDLIEEIFLYRQAIKLERDGLSSDLNNSYYNSKAIGAIKDSVEDADPALWKYCINTIEMPLKNLFDQIDIPNS